MAWKVLGRNRPGISAFFILTVILAAFWPLRASASEDVVRVGFFPMSGYQEYDEQGNPKGYNVEYLDQVSAYTGWTYEYVPVDSWDDALKALRNGDIAVSYTHLDVYKRQVTERLDQPITPFRTLP